METKCVHCGEMTPVVVKRKSKSSPDAKEVILHYIDLFKKKYSHEPEINWAASTLATNKMLKTRTKEELKSKLSEYLESTESFFHAAGYRYLLFPAWIQKEVVKETTKKLCDVKSVARQQKAWDGLL